MYEGAGLGPEDVDIFNPYDGYAPMTQFFLEAFQWHGVKRGDAFAFYAAISRSRDRTRCARAAAIWGTGGRGRRCTPTASSNSAARLAPRQVTVRAETALGAIHHAEQWGVDHVRETPELRGCGAEGTGW